MRYCQGNIGRIFAVRLDEGERLPEAVEDFCRLHKIRAALVIYVGGAQDGSCLVVGPDADRQDAVIPIVHTLKGIQELLGVGTIFPNDAGDPVLHMHVAAGREGRATVGCSRAGVEVWLIGEVLILEILDTTGVRHKDPATGFQLLDLT